MALKKVWLKNKNNIDAQNNLDPNDLNRNDPCDTPIEAAAEARRNFDPIDTPFEAKEQMEDEPTDNENRPKF